MSVRVYVGNLPKEVKREDLENIFSDHSEEIVSIKLVTDRKTGKCRGFGFVTLKSDEQADAIVEKFNNQVLEENTLKVEKALPRSKGKEGEEGGDSNRRKSPSKSSRSKSSGDSTEAAKPDPRWADELEKLKQLLATQTTGS